MGIADADTDGSIAIVVQSKMGDVRSNKKIDVFDTLLMIINKQGEIKDAAVIYQGSQQFDMYVASHGIVSYVSDGDWKFYFAGWSQGF